MPDSVGGVALYSLMQNEIAPGQAVHLRVKGGVAYFDENVIAIAPGFFTGISVVLYAGGITAGTISFFCSVSGQGLGPPLDLGPGANGNYLRYLTDEFRFNAGDELQAFHFAAPDYAGHPDTGYTVAVWFTYTD
jgi:hypothetical protein